jgi:hypothetical protein
VSRAEFIRTDLWDEVESLTPWATLLFIWSWTNDKCNMAGLYRASRTAMTESKCPKHKVDAVLEELRDYGFIYYVDGYLWVCARVKYLAPRDRKGKNPLIATSVASDLAKIDPAHPLRRAWWVRYGDELWLQDAFGKKGLLEPKSEGASKDLRRVPEEADAEEEAEVVPLRTSHRSL